MKSNLGEGAFLLITRAEIQKTERALGRRIEKDYKGLNPILLVILKGAYVFAAELSLALRIPHEIEFAIVSSYGDNVVSSNTVRFLMDKNVELFGRHVIVVEDITDTGFTLNYIFKILEGRGLASLAACVLLDKAERRITPVKICYPGISIPNCYVIGHGLDFQGRFRHLPNIWAVSKEWIARNSKKPEVTANNQPAATVKTVY